MSPSGDLLWSYPTTGFMTVSPAVGPDGTVWVATVDGAGVAVRLRGNPDHPYSRGELCPKVNRFLDRVYSPDHITTPLIRTGPTRTNVMDIYMLLIGSV